MRNGLGCNGKAEMLFIIISYGKQKVWRINVLYGVVSSNLAIFVMLKKNRFYGK